MDMSTAESINVLPIQDCSQMGYPQRSSQQLAEFHGFDGDGGRVAPVSKELASNILNPGRHGEMHLQVLPRPNSFGTEMLAVDRPHGFDLEACRADGFSTGGTQGIGLGSISRPTEVFDVYADARGAVHPRSDRATDIRFGVSQHSLHNDHACGDVWQLAYEDGNISALIIDGLGHGEEAERAGLAGAETFALKTFAKLLMLMEDIHHDMIENRDGAIASAQFDAGRASLTLAASATSAPA
jgi:hypothetical protein